MVDQREMDKIKLRVLAEECSAPTAALAPAPVPTAEKAASEPPADIIAAEKPRRSYAFIASIVILLGAIVLSPAIGMMRTQALASIADKMPHNTSCYVDNRADLATAFISAGNTKAAEQVYSQLLAEFDSTAKLKTNDLNRPYVRLLLAKLKVKGDWKESEALIKTALNEITATGDTERKNCPPGLTSLVQSLAEAADRNETSHNHTSDKAKQEKTASELYEMTLALWNYAPGCGTKSNCQADLAQLYENAGEHQKALDSFVEAYNAFKTCGDTSFNAYRLQRIGYNLRELHQYSQAEPILEKAVTMTKLAWNGSPTLISSQITLARTKYDLHKYSEAKTLLKAALVDSSRLSDGTEYCWAKYYLAQCARATGDVSSARKLYEEVLVLIDKYPGPPIGQVQQELKSLTAKTIDSGHK